MDEAASPSGMTRGAMIVPIAHIGALSQAWFDALGLARPRGTQARSNAPAASRPTAASPVALPARSFDAPQAVVKAAPPAARRASDARGVVGSALFERATRKIARKDAAAVGRARGGDNDPLRRSAGRIVIRTTRGAVKMLVQRDNARLTITAVCDAKVAGSVAAALEAARGHLRARGIAADVRTYGENAA